MSAQERYDELKAGEDAMNAVDRLRFFCSLAMNGQDWIDVEPYFDGVTAELAALRADAEKWQAERAELYREQERLRDKLARARLDAFQEKIHAAREAP
jgi:hypothetical protein